MTGGWVLNNNTGSYLQTQWEDMFEVNNEYTKTTFMKVLLLSSSLLTLNKYFTTARVTINETEIPSQYFFVQSQQWKHYNKMKSIQS